MPQRKVAACGLAHQCLARPQAARACLFAPAPAYLPWSLIFCPASLTFSPALLAQSLPLSTAFSVAFLALSAVLSMASLALSLKSAMALLLEKWTRFTHQFTFASGVP